MNIMLALTYTATSFLLAEVPTTDREPLEAPRPVLRRSEPKIAFAPKPTQYVVQLSMQNLSADHPIAAPTIITTEGQPAQVRTEMQRPFVIGVKMHDDGRPEPILHTVSTGLEANITILARTGNFVTAEMHMTFSDIGAVKVVPAGGPNTRSQSVTVHKNTVTKLTSLSLGHTMTVPCHFNGQEGVVTLKITESR